MDYIKSFEELFKSDKRPKRVAIFTHYCPDPDAIASCMALEWTLKKQYEIESEAFYEGAISHPQNVALVNLIDPNLKPIEEFKSEKFDFFALVDTVTNNAGIGKNKIDFDLVIDHHREQSDAKLCINLKAGSCCAIIYDIIKNLNIEISAEADVLLATAILVGISTDTDHMMSEDCSNYELRAWADLLDIRDVGTLKRIVNYSRPKYWVECKANCIMNADIADGIAIVGMGFVPSKHRDMIADMSDELVTWEDVHTGIAFALVEGNRIEGSVRSVNASISIPKLCKELGGKYGNGGGKLGKGAYKYELGGGSIDDEDDEETKQDTWKLYKKKETKRINRILQK